MFWLFILIVVNGITLIYELKKEKEKRSKGLIIFSIVCILVLLASSLK